MMDKEQFQKLKEYIATLIPQYSIKDLVAEVHNLFQDYRISEEQEDELYRLVDPEEKENSPAELWYAGYGCISLWNYTEGRVV